MHEQIPLAMAQKKNGKHTCLKYLVILLISVSIMLTNIFIPKSTSAKAQSDCESLIKMALTGEYAIVLQVANNFNFKGHASGIFTKSVNGITSSTKMTEKQAQGFLTHFLYDKIIRVSAGTVTMDENGYSCGLQILPNNKGIAISMTCGDSLSVKQGQLEGIIKGNTMTAEVEVIENTLVNGIGNGLGATGQLAVSVKVLPIKEWPPLPPTNLIIEETPDYSIKLSWEDPNPDGLVVGYDIYRLSGVYASGFTKIASIGKGSSWIDTSEVAKTQNDFLSYYIVAKAKNGKVSVFSSMVNIELMYRMFRF